MKINRSRQKIVATLVTVAFSFICLFVAPVQAAMVNTADILNQQNSDLARQKVLSFMERQDVAQQIAAWGVAPDEAKARVAVMNDEELQLLAQKIDQLPAGGGALGAIILVAFVTFIVLIILDITGVTDIFTFIKKH